MEVSSIWLLFICIFHDYFTFKFNITFTTYLSIHLMVVTYMVFLDCFAFKFNITFTTFLDWYLWTRDTSWIFLWTRIMQPIIAMAVNWVKLSLHTYSNCIIMWTCIMKLIIAMVVDCVKLTTHIYELKDHVELYEIHWAGLTEFETFHRNQV